MSFSEWFSRYYTYIFILVILIYTVASNRKMYSKVRGKFITLLVLVFVETFCAEAELQFSALPYRTIARMLFSTACYILRPLIMYVLLMIILRDDTRKKKLIYGIPLLITSLILIAGIPYSNNLVFSYSEDN